MRTALVASLALIVAPALASEPGGATPEERAAFAAAAARIGTGWDASHAACILDTVAIEDGPAAVTDLLGLTEAAAEGRETPGNATLQFVGRHGDSYYGIVADCHTPDAPGN